MSLPTFAPCQQYGAYVVLRTARWMWIGPFRSNYATEGYQNVLRVVRRLLVTFFLLVTCISTFWWLVCLIATLWSDVNGLSIRCSMFLRFSSLRFFQIAPQLRRKRSLSYIQSSIHHTPAPHISLRRGLPVPTTNWCHEKHFCDQFSGIITLG